MGFNSARKSKLLGKNPNKCFEKIPLCTNLQKLNLKRESPLESKRVEPGAVCFAFRNAAHVIFDCSITSYEPFFGLSRRTREQIKFPGMLSVPTPLREYICSLPIVIIIPRLFLSLARHSWQPFLLLHEADCAAGWLAGLGCPDLAPFLLLQLPHLTSLSRNPATASEWHPAKSTAPTRARNTNP